MPETSRDPLNLPWLREQLHRKTQALEHEISAHQHTLDLLRLTEKAYGRFVSRELLGLLRADSILELTQGQNVETTMTVLFSDIRGFTQLSERMTPSETYAFVNSYLSEMEPAISAHGGVIDKFIGDAIMALFAGGADTGLQSAIEMLQRLDHYNEGRTRAGYPAVHIGIGLNTGIVMLGLVGGSQRTEVTVLSDAVNLASRLEDATKVYGTPLLISEHTLYSLADPEQYGIRFIDRIRVKGRHQPQSVYEVFDTDAPALREGKRRTRIQFEKAAAYYHLKAIDQAQPLLEACLQEVPDDQPARVYLARCHTFRQTGLHEGTGEVGCELAWRDEFTVGEPTIDHQHQELLEHMNQLGRQVAQGDRAGIDEIMAFIANYAGFHFETEEAMMRAVDYPLMAGHVREHQTFVERYQRLAADITVQRHDLLYLGFQIQLFLFDWFANHSTKTDRHLGRFIANLHSHQPPAQG
jgi:hemerythrin